MKTSMDLREKSSVKLFPRPQAESDKQKSEPEPDEENYSDKALRTTEAYKCRRLRGEK